MPIIYLIYQSLIIDSFIYVFFNYYFLFMGSNQPNPQKNNIHGKINQYTLHDIIGHGSFGIVYLAESPKKQKFALKLIKIDDKIQDISIKEAETYVSLNHPNILKAREYFLYKQQTYLVIILQYCPDGDLQKIIGKINQEQCENIMKQIAEGMTYIHSKDLTHRDIKPQNILMMNGVPKITDFGLTKSMTSTGASTKIGTPFYMPPEIQFEEKYDQNRKYLADVWSLGIVFLELLLGRRIMEMIEGSKMPCFRQDFPPKALLDKIQNKRLRNLIRQMLEKDPHKRLSLKEVFETLKHKNRNEETQVQPIQERQQVNDESFRVFDGWLAENQNLISVDETHQPAHEQTNVQLIDQRSEVKQENFEQFQELIAKNYKFSKLKKVQVGPYNKIKDKGLKGLIAKAGNFPNITIFDVSQNEISSGGLKLLLEAASNFPNLAEIYFSWNKITDYGMKALPAAAGNISNLKTIDLAQNQITNEGVKALVTAASSLPNLEIISLEGNQITDEGLRAFAFDQEIYPNLREINFRANFISDDGATSLGVSGNSFPNLELINLSCNQITNKGVQSMVGYAHQFKKLKEVNLYGNKTKGWFLDSWLAKQDSASKFKV